MSRSPKTETRMDLILWRHAEAEDRDHNLPDARRRLTPRGEEQARRMARWLKKHLPKKVRILVSPTQRTQMTAHALGMPFEVVPALGPDATAAALLAAAGWPDQGGTVLIVGHQPTLSRSAALLLAGNEEEWAMRKGAVWWLSHRARKDEALAALHAFIGPELI